MIPNLGTFCIFAERLACENNCKENIAGVLGEAY